MIFFPIWCYLITQVFPTHFNTCDEVLNAGADQVVCHPGGSVFLDADFTGDPSTIIDIQWTPSTGLSNPKILNPVANVNQTITYNLTLSHYSEENLFFNGDFEQGNSGFISDYIHSPNNLIPEGVYAITPNPNIQHPGFSPCPDHTSGTGNMMAVNGSGVPNQDVWCQTVNVTPNTNYVFIAWATSLVSASPAILQFSVNNVLLGNSFQISPTTCQWQQFFTTWNSGAATTATFCVVNQNTATGGNDFALDDIFLGEACIYTDEITITVLDEILEEQEHILCPGEVVEIGGELFDYPGVYEISLISSNGCDSIIIAEIESVVVEAIIEDPEYLTCEVTQIDLNGSLSFGSNGIDYYLWTTNNGSIISDSEQPIVTINAEGLYQLVVSTTYNGVTCYDTAEIEIFQDTFSPQFLIIEPERLSCSDSTLFLEAVNVDIPPGSTYMWSTTGGRILNGGQSLNPQVQGTGIYFLEITNPLNGCRSIQQVEVLGDTSLPVILLLEAPDITCRNNEISIRIELPGESDDFLIQWQTANGRIESGDQTENPLVSAPGAYIVEVINPETGCKSSLSIEIMENKNLPDIVLRDRDTLGCMMDSIGMQLILNPDTMDLEIIWSTSDGMILSGSNSQIAVAGSPGTYRVSIINNENGCSDSSEITIIKYEDFPSVVAGDDLTIDCRDSIVIPDIMGSDIGPEFSIRWYRNGIDFSQQITPEINTSGIYILEILNNSNQCISYDTIEVVDIRQDPEVFIEAPLVLNCLNPEIEIDASNSSPAFVEYSWQGPAGGLQSSEDSSIVIVQRSGWYYVTVSNPLNYCISVDSVFILADQEYPVIRFLIPDTLSCSNNSVTLNAGNSSPADRIEYSWTGPSGGIQSDDKQPQVLVSQGGWYVLSVRDTINGCISLDSIFVIRNLDLPEFSISPPDTLSCKLTTIQLFAQYDTQWQNISFEWTTPNGNFSAGEGTLTPIVDKPGEYILRIQNTANGCTDSIMVRVEENITPPLADAGFDGIIPCEPMEYALTGAASTGQGSLDYLWTTATGSFSGETDQDIAIATSPGIYLLRVTDYSNGCSATDTVQLRAELPERIDWVVANPDCDEDTGTLFISNVTGGQAPYIIQIDGNDHAIGSNVTLLPGLWSIKVIDSRGCEKDSTVLISEAEPLSVTHLQLLTISQGDQIEVVLSFSLPLDEIASVIWLPEDGVTPGVNLSSWILAPNITTNYQIIVRSLDGCESVTNLTVIVRQGPAIFVPNVFSPKDRNGINDRFFPISRPGSVKSIIKMEVFDRWGAGVFHAFDFQPDQPESGWNGTHKGLFVNPAVFIWSIEAELINGEIIVLFGEVTVL